MTRIPDEYKEPASDRRARKWDKIISAFLDTRIDDLEKIHRAGTRGRILHVIAAQIFNELEIPFIPEPIFYHVSPNSWYVDFAEKNDLKLRTHDFYNPDMILEDGTWVEFTLSENTAYKKLFRYGHQADDLLIYWLDDDEGYHKEICRSVHFPNAEVKNIDSFTDQLRTRPRGTEIIDRLKLLKDLQGIIM